MKTETLLFKKSVKGDALGKLPIGTVFTFLGEKENGFAKVRIELEDGKEIEGWIFESYLQKNAPKPVDNVQEPFKVKKGKVELKKGAVPKDEALLLRREPTFQYGLLGGVNFDVLSHSNGDGTYNGVGAIGGAFLGFYLDKDITIRTEAAYSLHNGTGGDGQLSFGLLDLGLVAELNINKLLLFGGLRYDFGVGIGNIPRTVQLGVAAELNSLWGDFGVGYRFPLTDVMSFAVRGKYGASFVRSPVAFSCFTLLTYLEIQG